MKKKTPVSVPSSANPASNVDARRATGTAFSFSIVNELGLAAMTWILLGCPARLHFYWLRLILVGRENRRADEHSVRFLAEREVVRRRLRVGAPRIVLTRVRVITIKTDFGHRE